MRVTVALRQQFRFSQILWRRSDAYGEAAGAEYHRAVVTGQHASLAV
jgi:hypothetical protein